MEKEIAIVFMCAGISSRFGGKIKQFAKIGPNGETLIEYSLNQALKSGFSKIIFIVGEKTEKPFRELFKTSYKGIPISYVLQTYDIKKRDKPWGTIEAVCNLRGAVNKPFIVCNGDDIYGEKTFKILFNKIKEGMQSATIGYKLREVLPEKGNVNRGIFEANEDGTIKSIREELGVNWGNLKEKNLNPKSLCNMNIFAFQPEVLEELYKVLMEFKKTHENDRTAEAIITAELGKLIKAGLLKMNVYSTPERWFGITNPEDEAVVREQLKNINK